MTMYMSYETPSVGYQTVSYSIPATTLIYTTNSHFDYPSHETHLLKAALVGKTQSVSERAITQVL